jgi:hypothetical protein
MSTGSTVQSSVGICEIRDIAGEQLATGRVLLRTPNDLGEFVVVGLNQPELLLQRYLVDGLHEVLVGEAGQPPEPATLDRFAFTIDHGLVCVLCLPLYSPDSRAGR